MEKSPWDASTPSASQGIPHILRNQKIYYSAHPAPVPILSQVNPGHNLTNDVFKIHSNMILPFMTRSYERPLSFRFSHQISICTSPVPHTCYMPQPSHSSWSHHPINIWWAIQIMTFLNMQSPPVPCYLVPLKPKYLSQRRILEHPQPIISGRLLPEASKFQHHIKLCSKCSTTLASSSIPSPMC